ncbi:malto-oligosyltrehalose synthase [soil metagenome]
MTSAAPRATYRLQFTADFRFADAAALAGYLAELGISHVYASPVFAARPGSTHGYDVTDPNRLNPELGTEADFRAMAAAFRERGLGLILDIVPNHMGVGGAENAFWLSLLEWGAASPHGHRFDIDWQAPHPGLAGKVLVPFLGAPYGEALAGGALALRFDAGEGGFAVWAHDTHKLPVCPRHYADILREGTGLDTLVAAAEKDWDEADPEGATAALKARLAEAARDSGTAAALRDAAGAFAGRAGEAASWGALDGLIARQHWRAAKYTLDRDAINYRRFFTISDLAGVRVELPEVFDATHALVLGLIEDGTIEGIRIDHIDGLRDPKAYTLRLRERMPGPVLLYVEKIVAPGERLPESWRTDGTTGYEVANLLVGLLADPAATEAMSAGYAAFTGQSTPPRDIVHEAKRQVLAGAMAAELEALVERLLGLGAGDRGCGDLGRSALRTGLAEVIAALRVYRTYADADGLPEADRPRLDAALAEARRRAPGLDPGVIDFIGDVLTLAEAEKRPAEADAVRETAYRTQQLSGPVMAKGLEDAALYRHNRLIALNEVGSEPGRHDLDVGAFHAANAERQAREPLALLTTSTHDTKRGEDARARIAALTADPAGWAERVRDWQAMLTEGGARVDPNEEYFFYQLLFGAWPAEWAAGTPPPPEALDGLRERVAAAMLKSVREAGVNTRWVFGDTAYEAAVAGLIARALDPSGRFLQSFAGFAAGLARDGAANGLVQTALKLTMPGVPDIYQGAELWEQSLVDPDNRRAVDFTARAVLLARLRAEGAPVAAADWPSGTVKLALIAALLDLRSRKPGLFAQGAYLPLAAEGPEAASLCAFMREAGEDRLLVAVAPHPAATRREGWEETRLALSGGGVWRNILDGRDLETLAAPELFRDLPAAVLVPA